MLKRPCKTLCKPLHSRPWNHPTSAVSKPDTPAKPSETRFLSSPIMIRLPCFLMFSVSKGPYNKKGKHVLLRNLVVFWVDHGP